MTNNKKYNDGIRIARTAAKTGKTIVKIKTYFIVGLVLTLLIVIGVVAIRFYPYAYVNGGDGGTIPTDPTTEYDIIAPILDPIMPLISTDGNIRLDWDDAEVVNSDLLNELELSYYNVYKRKDSGIWISILVFNEFYHDYNLAEGTYEYKVQSVFYKPIEVHCSEFSAIQSVVVDTINYPSNPSIKINDGALTTNSLEVTLTLSCENADEMQFQISIGQWTNWTAYKTTHIIILSEDDPDAPPHRVGVIFRNDDGTTEDAGYNVYADIIYDPDTEPPPENDEKEEDYILLVVVLILILGGLIGIVVFLKFGKKDKKSN